MRSVEGGYQWSCRCCYWPCPGRGWAHDQTACERRGGGRGRGVVGDSWRFHPPNTLLKQEGLQLAEASFRDMASNPLKWMIETGINWIWVFWISTMSFFAFRWKVYTFKPSLYSIFLWDCSNHSSFQTLFCIKSQGIFDAAYKPWTHTKTWSTKLQSRPSNKTAQAVKPRGYHVRVQQSCTAPWKEKTQLVSCISGEIPLKIKSDARAQYQKSSKSLDSLASEPFPRYQTRSIRCIRLSNSQSPSLCRVSARQCRRRWTSPGSPRSGDSLESKAARDRSWDPSFDPSPNLAA